MCSVIHCAIVWFFFLKLVFSFRSSVLCRVSRVNQCSQQTSRATLHCVGSRLIGRSASPLKGASIAQLIFNSDNQKGSPLVYSFDVTTGVETNLDKLVVKFGSLSTKRDVLALYAELLQDSSTSLLDAMQMSSFEVVVRVFVDHLLAISSNKDELIEDLTRIHRSHVDYLLKSLVTIDDNIDEGFKEM
jgi:hypothetical protein